MRAGRGPAARAELEPAKRSGAAAVGIIRRFGISCVMALRGGFARLFRRRADAGLRLSRRAHSVALVGAPFSRGQVGAGPGRAGPGGRQRRRAGGGGLSLGADRCGLRAAMEADGSQATSGGPGEAQHDPG